MQFACHVSGVTDVWRLARQSHDNKQTGDLEFMRNRFPSVARTPATDGIEAEAWVVLEMHFLSRPHLIEEARSRLAACIAALRAEGLSDPVALKDQACRKVQMQFGPAPALNDDARPPRARVA